MQLVILSGKGGTGKTTVAAALARLAACPLAVDCDVDAANLHLLLEVRDLESQDFSGAKIAQLKADLCRECGLCSSVCRFQAIVQGVIDPFRCEGCGTCVYACPQQAIELVEQVTGQVILTSTDWGWLSRATMRPGAAGSGKLVTSVRGQGFQVAGSDDLIILDGSPGIGCPVMATLTGCNAALVVLEPTKSSQQDFLRLLDLLRRFGIKAYACINRFDLSPEITEQLQASCLQESVPIVGLIPYDPLVLRAHRHLKSILSYADSAAAVAIRQLWDNLSKLIGVNEQ